MKTKPSSVQRKDNRGYKLFVDNILTKFLILFKKNTHGFNGQLIHYMTIFQPTECEKNVQLKCISVFGTASLLRGSGGSPCHVTKLVDCMSKEKAKKECVVDDKGTVYYINAFLRNVNKNKCMDDFDFAEVQHLFQTSSE